MLEVFLQESLTVAVETSDDAGTACLAKLIEHLKMLKLIPAVYRLCSPSSQLSGARFFRT